MKLIIACIILLSSVTLFCQESFKSGYIVKNNGDTISCQIRNDVEEKLTKEVVFKSANGSVETYTPQNIISFGFYGGNIFRVVKYVDPSDDYSKKEHFAKLLFDGINDLYSFIRKDIFFFVGAVRTDTTLLLFNDITSASGRTIDQGNYQNQLFLSDVNVRR